MPSLLDVAVFAIPAAICAALSYRWRSRPLALILTWMIGYPVFWAVTVVTTLLVSYQVFGIDLID